MVEKVIDTVEEIHDDLSVEVDHDQIQKGWDDYVQKRKLPDEPTEEYMRGYISAQMTQARVTLSPRARSWMAAREEDRVIIAELRKKVRSQDSEINNLKAGKALSIAINILFMLGAFIVGIWIESPR